MAEPPVVDASPIIVLVRADLLLLLRQAGDDILVQVGVALELQRRGSSNPAVRALANTDWLTIVEAPSVPPNIRALDLGPGESEVIAWALAHPGCEAIIDDLNARLRAASVGISVIGCVGLVLRAKQRDVLPLARPALESLQHSGLYLARRVLDDALALVGE